MAKVIQFPMTRNPPIVWADISRYQASNPEMPPVKHFDFNKYLAKGAPMICIRGQVANEGIDYEFEYNRGQCQARQLPYIVYHYIKLWKSIPNQIASIVSLTNAIKSDPLYRGSRLDIEANDGLSKNIFTGNAEKLVSGIFSGTGQLPWIYTRGYFWDANTYIDGWMKGVEWWIAHHFYGLNPQYVPSVRPLLPACIAEINKPFICVDWQFDTHDQGADWGSMGDNEIDLNFFTWNDGTDAAFAEKYGVNLTPPPPVVVPGEPLYRIETLGNLNVRRGAGLASTTDPDDGTVLIGSILPVYEEKSVAGYPYPWGRIGGWVYMNPTYVKKTTKT